MDDKKLLDLVNQSGFPLHIAVAHVVEETQREHGWRVIYKEHSWKNELDEQEGFLDLVLRNRPDSSILAVECKRVLESTWAFLIPEDGSTKTARRHAKAWLHYCEDARLLHSGWTDLAIDPESPEAAFCVVPGQDPRSRPMLERTAAELVSATEALAHEEEPLNLRLSVFFSVLVTTSKLKVCNFDPKDVSISDGAVSSAIFLDVPFVRFRKQLSTRASTATVSGGDRFHALELAKEHTVFVVNSECLVQFLKDFEVDDGPLIRACKQYS